MGWKAAAVSTVETGEIADIKKVKSEAYDDKGKWLEGLGTRPGWDAKVAFYDTAPDKAEEVKRDTGVEAVVPDLMHEQRNVLCKVGWFEGVHSRSTAQAFKA